jgi:dual specificity phosphatase 12
MADACRSAQLSATQFAAAPLGHKFELRVPLARVTARKCAECARDIFEHSTTEVDEVDLQQVVDVCADTTPSVILPGELLVGSFCAALAECRRDERVVVLNCAGRGLHSFLPKTEAPFESLCRAKRVLDLEWRDDTAFGIDVPELIAALRWAVQHVNAGRPLVVNCAQGKSRSGVAATAYLMATKDLTAADALAFVRQRRPFVQPNPGFMVQLVAMQETVKGTIMPDLLHFRRNPADIFEISSYDGDGL